MYVCMYVCFISYVASISYYHFINWLCSWSSHQTNLFFCKPMQIINWPTRAHRNIHLIKQNKHHGMIVIYYTTICYYTTSLLPMNPAAGGHVQHQSITGSIRSTSNCGHGYRPTRVRSYRTRTQRPTRKLPPTTAATAISYKGQPRSRTIGR